MELRHFLQGLLKLNNLGLCRFRRVVKGRRFDSALSILNNLLKGLEGPSDSKFEHLIGCTHHNIGIIHMCQGNFACALECFQKAVAVRTRCLPRNHPDITVGGSGSVS
jgi:tetratricopeptide (TPR) repeat protein